MKAKGILLLVISLVLGLGAVQWIRGLTKNTPEATASIVVAKSHLNFGDRISSNDLQLVRWPTDALPEGAFTDVSQIAGPSQDRVVLRPIEPNEPVLASKVSGSGGKASLSTIIDQDMRAMTIHVNDATGVAGFITPGDRVDIILTRDDGGNSKETSKTDILLQNILVRGIDQEANERSDKPTVVKAVTVEVTPADAQKLTLGSNIGTLSFALRNLASSQQVTTRSLSVKDLQPEPALLAPPRPKKTGPQIEIVRGTGTSSYAVTPDSAAATSETRATKS